MKRIAIAALLGASVAALVLAASRTVAFRDLDFWAYDFLINHGGYAPQSRAVVVVDFDDETFRAIDQYPIPRQAFADVLDRVAASGPRVIGVDLFVSEARGLGEDARFRDALSRAGNVVLASQVAAGGIPGVRPLPAFCDPEDATQPSGFCREGSGGALGYGFVNLPVESDGFVRRFFLFSAGPRPGVSFAAMLAQQYTGEALRPLAADRVSFLGKAIPLADPSDRSVWIGAWRPRIAERIPALDLLGPARGRAHDFHDKLVLIGQSHDAARDRFQTPLFRPDPGPRQSRLRVSGVELHAAAIETLLTGRVITATRRGVAWALLLLAAVLSAWVVLALNLNRAVVAITAAMAGIYAAAQGAFSFAHLWMPYPSLLLAVAGSVPAGLAYRFVEERLLRSAATRERELMMRLFSRYVSPDVAQEIWKRRGEVVLAGEQRTATVLFSDIRGFTAMTAGRNSQDVLRWLNEYLTAMDEVVRAHGGMLNKFIGDGIMVLFGVPLSEGVERDAVRAMRAALAMQTYLERANHGEGSLTRFGPVHIGIGVHTGPLTCGNVGSEQRLEYSAIGETVNLASRLESLTKDLHVPIVMTKATADAIGAEFPALRDLGEIPIRGFDRPVHVYTIDAPPPTGNDG